MATHHRSLPVAMIPMANIDDAVAEAQRAAALGFRALSLPARVDEREYNSADCDPFWACANEIGLPLTFHSGTGYEPRMVRGQGANVLNYVLGAQLDGPRVLLNLAAGGALDRYPELRIVAVETGASWLGWVMTQADIIYSDHAMFAKTSLSAKPSEFIRRQCHATFMVDPVAVANREVTCVDCLMWGNDYPHPEGQNRICRRLPSSPAFPTKRPTGSWVSPPRRSLALTSRSSEPNDLSQKGLDQ